ncbi:MAG: geranylgeranylglycerol-phosphate geranylgeranyltransferase [Thaumarchaeota archaeon]|nr:geranylgeranylglycerol-phosphate geranylgeranyltransferase [Nitrososphaerota archaeon]MBI3117007.1 geranylgeranylglycerol-phosphate geranylgeranyltransferase [Nitrososphaerota archaeon]MCS4540236.1 geranylgeranylglycerol-phosphate geranylgeranyltransferase [Nitrososphaerota archaeon]
MSFTAGLSIIRPVNCVMIGFAVIVGAFVSKAQSLTFQNLFLGFLTGFSICAYSMVINDIYDIEVDRVNQPNRPLPSGRMTGRGARFLSIFMLGIGVISSIFTGLLLAVAVALAYAILSWTYNFRAKKYGLVGNVIVASSLAIPFIYGGVVAVGEILNSLLLFMALTSFLAGVGREVVKAMADTAGDAKRGVRSVAISRGMGSASAVGAVLFLLAIVTSIIPVIEGLASEFYMFGVLIPDIIFIYLAVSILRRPVPENALSVKKKALFGMLIGLVVFIGGAF